MLRLVTGLLALLLVSSLMGAQDAVANGGRFDFEADLDKRIVTWKDFEGETAYRVFGNVVYADLSCPPQSRGIPGGTFDFSEELLADTTSFELPPQNLDSRLSIKHLNLTIEAVDQNSAVLERDGFAMIVDEFCFDETLPSTGTGFEGDSSNRLLVGSVLLFALGGVSLLISLATLRRRA